MKNSIPIIVLGYDIDYLRQYIRYRLNVLLAVNTSLLIKLRF